MPMTFSGRLLAEAISPTLRADVLVANTQCSGMTCRDNIFKRWCGGQGG